MAKKKKSKSRVNEAGNYTKPAMRKRLFQRIKAGSKGGPRGVWSARKAQLLSLRYKKLVEDTVIKNYGFTKITTIPPQLDKAKVEN